MMNPRVLSSVTITPLCCGVCSIGYVNFNSSDLLDIFYVVRC